MYLAIRPMSVFVACLFMLLLCHKNGVMVKHIRQGMCLTITRSSYLHSLISNFSNTEDICLLNCCAV
jgi:uncharacterized membrane protein